MCLSGLRMMQSSPSPLWVGIKGGGESRALCSRNHTPTLLDSTDLADAKSYLASSHSSIALMAFSPKIAPPERSCLAAGSKPHKGEGDRLRVLGMMS